MQRLCHDKVLLCRNKVDFVTTKLSMSRLSQKQGKDRLCRDKFLLCRDRVHVGATKSQGKLCHDKDFDKARNFVMTKFYFVAT